MAIKDQMSEIVSEPDETLVVLVLPMDVRTVSKVLKALTRTFPGAMCRDAEHSGMHIQKGRSPRGTMEVIIGHDLT